MELLKDLVEDSQFVNQMNNAFTEIRSDVKITGKNEENEIDKLSKLHVDINGDLTDLVAKATKSSGSISGLRGTGKTHLFLLTKHEINKSITQNKTLCIYINLKNLEHSNGDNEELINRKFSILLYKELINHLEVLFLKNEESDYKWFDFRGKREERQQKEKILKVIQMLTECKIISKIGDLSIENSDIIKEHTEKTKEEMLTLGYTLSNGFSTKDGVNFDNQLTIEGMEKGIERIMNEMTLKNFLDISNVKDNIMNMLDILELERITLFIDDWEKIYDEESLLQKAVSNYLDKINDNPIYIWLGVVPGRNQLYKLKHGADLQHFINLDKNLIFENSDEDGKSCIKYFQEFVNKRLKYYIPNSTLTWKTLIKEEYFEMLVHASMGNSRDFANMLSHGWSIYRSKIGAGRGPRFKTINQAMLVNSIQHVGNQKLENIRENDETKILWNDIRRFCIEKKYSHFSIIDNDENNDAISTFAFQELIYNRLVHARKTGVATKDGTGEDLRIYSLNYGAIYDLMKSGDDKIKFVSDSKTIHDKIRRYIYNPTNIVIDMRIKSGQFHKCSCCDSMIDINKMKYAWETNSCPFYGGKIRQE